MTLADKIVVLNGGIISQAGSPMELYNNPQNRFVAEFIGNPKMNFLDAYIENNKQIKLAEGQLLPIANNGKTGDKIEIGIRPENIIIDDKSLIPVSYTHLEEHPEEGRQGYRCR